MRLLHWRVVGTFCVGTPSEERDIPLAGDNRASSTLGTDLLGRYLAGRDFVAEVGIQVDELTGPGRICFETTLPAFRLEREVILAGDLALRLDVRHQDAPEPTRPVCRATGVPCSASLRTWRWASVPAPSAATNCTRSPSGTLRSPETLSLIALTMVGKRMIPPIRVTSGSIFTRFMSWTDFPTREAIAPFMMSAAAIPWDR